MEHPSLPPSHEAGGGWQLVDEFELPIGPHMAATVYARLTKVLEHLNLPRDFQDRLLNSAQDVMARALPPKVESPFGHIHLSVFMPIELASQSRTWGFFRIEKIDSVELVKDHSGYAVEFYLYLEG